MTDFRWISNRRLHGAFHPAFNPSFVEWEGRRCMIYREGPRDQDHTRLFMTDLDESYQPVGRLVQLQLKPVSSRIVTYDDPRAFVWKGQLWVLHTQASPAPNFIRGYSACIVLSRVDREGQEIETWVPNFGRNINHSNAEAPFNMEKNWSPLVVGDELYLIYEISPLTVIQFNPDSALKIVQSNSHWPNPHRGYLSGSTPLLPWRGSEYIGLYHTFETFNRKGRRYLAGFYTVDTDTWRVTGISSRHELQGWFNVFLDLRRGISNRLQVAVGLKWSDQHEVVFPLGLLDQGKNWAVSTGWNDCRSFVALFDKKSVEKNLIPI
jgi:hypothetical protein